MQEVWFKEVKSSKEGRDKVKQDVGLAANAFERLDAILKKKHKSNLATDYDNASWPYLQADSNGYNRALQEVRKLIQGN